MKSLADCRLYTFVDSAYLNGRDPADIARQLCDGAADLIQLRAKDWPEDRIRATAEEIIPITRAAGIPLVINDHWQLACELTTEICHLGQEDFFESSISNQSSTINHQPAFGISTHAPEQAQRAMQTNAVYLAVGPVFPTLTKPGRPSVTLDYVRWAAENIERPWFAIGGITLENIDAVLEAGARRICVVSAILNVPDITHACQQFHKHLASVPLKM